MATRWFAVIRLPPVVVQAAQPALAPAESGANLIDGYGEGFIVAAWKDPRIGCPADLYIHTEHSNVNRPRVDGGHWR